MIYLLITIGGSLQALLQKSILNYSEIFVSKFQPYFQSTKDPEFVALQMYLMDYLDRSNSTLTLTFNFQHRQEARFLNVKD